MSQVSIRRAVPADAAALAAIAAETFPLACPPGTLESNIQAFIAEKLSPEAFKSYLGHPDYRLWLADMGGEVAGYAMAVHGEPEDPNTQASVRHRPTLELSKIYVRATHHGLGIAAALMDAAMAEARESQVASVWLGVNQQNVRANRFYEKNGFALVGERYFQVGEVLEADFVRERPLY